MKMKKKSEKNKTRKKNKMRAPVFLVQKARNSALFVCRRAVFISSTQELTQSNRNRPRK